MAISTEELKMEVARAVHILNHDVDSCNRVAANQWLVQFQQTNAAWEVATSILTSTASSSESSSSSPFHMEVEFFAAQILRRKIQNEGYYLQSVAEEILLNALFMAASRFSLGPPQLLTQICLALSALVLKAVEHKKLILQLFSNLHKLQSQEHGNIAVLEMLTVLPEEVTDNPNGDCSSDSALRHQFIGELLCHTPTVLEFLLCQSEQQFDENVPQPERIRKIMRCLLSWVRAGCFSEISSCSSLTHSFLNFVFNSLQLSCSFDIAIEVLIELVSRYEGLPQVFLFRINYIKEALLGPAISNRDEGIIGGLACFMSEIGQAAPPLIAEASTEALLLTDALLSCLAFPSEDWEISDSTLQFWCSLASYLNTSKLNCGEVKEMFLPIFSALLDALLLRAQVNCTSVDDYAGYPSMPDGLTQFRMNIEELLLDVCQILGSSTFVRKLYSLNWIPKDAPIPWLEVEVRMFALNAVAEAVLTSSSSLDLHVTMQLVAFLSCALPDGPKGFMSIVYKSVAEVVGSYSKCFLSYLKEIRLLLFFCAAGITEPISSKSCASALHKLCEDSSSIVQNPQDLEVLICLGEGLDKKDLSLDDEEEIVTAITLTLNSLPNKVLKRSSLERLLYSSYGSIWKLMDIQDENFMRQNPAAYTQVLNSAVRGLHRMGAVFGHLGVSNTDDAKDDTETDILGVFWPLLEKVFISYHVKSGYLSVAACRSLDQAIHASGPQFLMVLPEILDCLSKNFLLFESHDCYIRTATIIFEEFGGREEYGPLFLCTFGRFTSASSIITLNSYICDQKPDLVEAYSNFASTYVRCCPKGVIAASGNALELSLQKTAICSTAMHRGAALAAMSYISYFLEISITSILESLSCIAEGSLSAISIQIISECGEGVISNIIYALLGVSAISRVTTCTLVFW